MNKLDVCRLIVGLPGSLAAIKAAISTYINHEFALEAEIPWFHFSAHSSLMTREVFDHFRNTEYLLNHYPDGHWGAGMQTAVLRRKVLEYPELCFHVTDATAHQHILENGLYPGNRFGKSPRGEKFADSVHYIHACKTVSGAVEWGKTLFADKPFRICRIRIEGFGLIDDPPSSDAPQGGYILNTDHVPPTLIDEPDLL